MDENEVITFNAVLIGFGFGRTIYLLTPNETSM